MVKHMKIIRRGKLLMHFNPVLTHIVVRIIE
jgi:hypothetical protein